MMRSGQPVPRKRPLNISEQQQPLWLPPNYSDYQDTIVIIIQIQIVMILFGIFMTHPVRKVNLSKYCNNFKSEKRASQNI